MKLSTLCFFVSLLIGVTFSKAWAEAGVSDDKIVIGQCAALEGPAQGLGTGMNLGIRACFEEINAKGGIHGRKLELVAVNDGYDPDQCVDGTMKLIEEKKVFSLVGYVGTPTAKVAVPIVKENKIPLVGLFTGAMFLREPVEHYIINIRASYHDEAEMLIEHLTKDLGAKKIAVFYQDDSFGLAVLSGTDKALKKRGMDIVAKGAFERNTVAVQKGLESVQAANPDAIVMVGPYKPLAEFIKLAKEAKLNAALATVSFVGTNNLVDALGTTANGTVISQVVPFPADASLSIVKDYQEALKKLNPNEKPGFISFEGYLSARTLAIGLEKTGKGLTREGLIDALESIQGTDLGGITLNLSKTNHQASNTVFLTQVKNGQAVPVTKLEKP